MNKHSLSHSVKAERQFSLVASRRFGVVPFVDGSKANPKTWVRVFEGALLGLP